MLFQLRKIRPPYFRVWLIVCLLSAYNFAIAQNLVRGTVSNNKGVPLIGASIRIEGTNSGTITDVNGKFNLNVDNGKRLIVSYVGYITREVSVNSSVLNISLEDDGQQLDEVVVIGYGSIARKDVTSSISTVKSSDFNVGAYTDPGQLLQGKVPGLVVVQNSDPNGGVNSLTLRGASTLNGSTSPLYVVDGIPGVNLNLISPNDIESIDVLRDASATAIYGSKAANGVIMVTTKRGQDGPARVAYSSYVSWERIHNDHKMMNADELRTYAKQNDLTIPNDKGGNTNWADEVQRTGLAHNHNLSITGGNKSTTYNASANYIEREGIITGVGNNLFTARTFIETKTLKDRLTLSAGLNGNIRNEWGVPRGEQGASVYNAMYYYSPFVTTRNNDGTWYKDMGISQNFNPLALIYEDQSRATFKRIQATGKATLKLIDDLYLNGNFAYENQNYSYKDYHSHQSQTNNRGGETSRNTTEDIKKMMEIYGNYNKTFNDSHKLGLMAGYSWEEQNNGEGFGARGFNFYDDSIWWNNIGLANSWDEDPVWANTLSTIRLISFYGRVNYSNKNKYILQAAVRRDGSSTFGSNHKWATFPSGAIAWRLSEEDFIKNLGIFDDLKLRAGWGQSGNAMGFDIYTSRFYYQGGNRFVYTDPETGKETSYKSLNAARNVNPDLKWETTSMLNLGVDFSFLGGRINGTVEYYDKTTKDMIWSYPVSTSYYPVGWLVANVGKMNNRGVELTLNATPIRNKDFNWTTSLNFSHNRNRIVSLSNQEHNAGVLNRYNPSLPGASTATIQRILEGQPIGTFYMWEWAGYNENGLSQFYVRDETTGERTGATTITPGEKDRTIVGNAQPWLTMGWNNNLMYKNWDFNTFFTGVFGQKIFNEPRAYFSNIGNITDGKNVMKSIISEQRATDTSSALPSDRYLEDGSYFRLATLTAGYTFHNFNGWLRDLRLYASCNNVFTLTSYSGRDPEINLGGETPGCDTRSDHFPRTRQILIGATINF